MFKRLDALRKAYRLCELWSLDSHLSIFIGVGLLGRSYGLCDFERETQELQCERECLVEMQRTHIARLDR
jgi:hypothetical protein